MMQSGPPARWVGDSLQSGTWLVVGGLGGWRKESGVHHSA